MTAFGPTARKQLARRFWSSEYLLRHCEGFVVDSDSGRLGLVAGVDSDAGRLALIVRGPDGDTRVPASAIRHFDPYAERIAVAPDPVRRGEDEEPAPPPEPPAPSRAERGLRVRDLMTRTVVTVAPDSPLRAVAHTLVEHGIGGVPVCQADGAVVGVVSEADIVLKEACLDPRSRPPLSRLFDRDRDLARSKAEATTAAEAMTWPPLTIEPDATVADAARAMIERGIDRLPVLDDGRLVGIVTRSDLVRAFDRSDDELARDIEADAIASKLSTDPSRVRVDVRGGRATLSGEVATRVDAEIATAYARRVPGVVAVDATALVATAAATRR